MPLCERVEGLVAEPANDPVERLQATFATQPRIRTSPFQQGCYAAAN
ncbi:MAG: hypothetical protein HC840_30455 [Leptolyngbyaceae cyanobacterium RM2_2_4]|nr:hypothetical protein [Leptolyngbyaceae cyanobacterium RM2_2_4]